MQEMKDIQEERRVAMDSVASRMGNKTIEVSGLCKSYGDKKLIDNYEYIFLKNDRIGIIGSNGWGISRRKMKRWMVRCVSSIMLRK